MSTATVEPAALPESLLDRGDLARLFKVHPMTVDRWIKEGRLPAPIRLGRHPRWRPADIAKLLAPATGQGGDPA